MEPAFHRSNFHLRDLRDGLLLPPSSNEEYVPQYVNYHTHGYHDVSGPYIIDMDTSVKENSNRYVNPRRKKSRNREPRGPESYRRKQIEDHIAPYEAGLAKLRAE